MLKWNKTIFSKNKYKQVNISLTFNPQKCFTCINMVRRKIYLCPHENVKTSIY